MDVTFTRTGERRYRVSISGPDVEAAWMEPAPGYDARLPHDMAHFVVENELGILGGVFGQLAAGGTANTFHPLTPRQRRKRVRKGKELARREREDALFSEHVIAAACGKWTGDPLAPKSVEGVSEQELSKLCGLFDQVSEVWSKLKVGEGMTLAWTAEKPRRR